MTIDIDINEAQRPLTLREKIGIRILLMVFVMIYPKKYDHQLKPMLEHIARILE